jgi:hypothetical protein
MKRNGIMPGAPSHRWIQGGDGGITRWSGL